MINEFIEKIIGHAPEKIDGDRTQQVDIYLKFIGRFDLPAPELTPEEEKRQAALHRHRVKSRERYQKIKAGEHAVEYSVLRPELPGEILPSGSGGRQEP